MATLLSIRNNCKQESDNVGQTFISDTEWDGYIQKAYQELYGLWVEAYGNNYFVKATPYSFTTDGTNDNYALPSDFFKLLGVDLRLSSSPNSWVPLKPFAFADRNRFSFFNGTVPMAGQVIRVFYIPTLTLPTVDADTITTPNGWEEYIVIDACIRALAKEESDVSVMLMRKQAFIERLKHEQENRDAGSPAAIVDTRGRTARAMMYNINGNNLWLIGNSMPAWGPWGDWGNDSEYIY